MGVSMNIPKAIEILQSRVDGECYYYDPSDTDDIKLGIEALKAIVHSRELHGISLFNPLPGETKE